MIKRPGNILRLFKKIFLSNSLRLSSVVDRHCDASVFRAIRNDGTYVPDLKTSRARSHNT